MQMNLPDIEPLKTLIKQASRKAQSIGAEGLVSYTQRWDAIDPLDLFSAAEGVTSDRWFWEHPAGDYSITSVGILSGVTPPRNVRFQEVDRIIRDVASRVTLGNEAGLESAGPLFFAAFSFDPIKTQDRLVWQGFPSTYVLTPRLTLTRNGGEHTLTINAVVSAGLDPDGVVRSVQEFNSQLVQALAEQRDSDLIVDELPPDKTNQTEIQQFLNSIHRAESAVRNDQLEFLTVARRQKITTGGLYRLKRILRYLRGRFPHSRIVAAGRHGSTFIGHAQAEILQVRRRELTAECVTGSIRRGDTPDLDAALANQLLDAPGAADHHERCVDHLFESLEGLCDELSAPDEPEVLSTTERHHLHSTVNGSLQNGSSLMDCLKAIYPTVETSGSPSSEASAFLHEFEDVDRGWFSAPFGWLDLSGDGAFIVPSQALVIRAPVLHQQRAFLFTSTLVQSGADPEDEIARTTQEFEPLKSALKQ
jgi:menaquinone-specific isochorismate synthase